jgi:hypothetical protein
VIDDATPVAFPHEYKFGDGTAHLADGITLRDYFAAKAMQGILAGDHPITRDFDCLEKTAHAAYAQADAMLKERST